MRPIKPRQLLSPLEYCILVFAILALAALSSCSADTPVNTALNAPGSLVPSPTPKPIPTPSLGLATILECPTGGTAIVLGDTRQIVCNGLNGSNGLDATPVKILQFCPGMTVYPSAFLEIGLVINSKVYAVYSVNSGFLAYLPPGDYRSNAVGSQCDFRLNLDNTVTSL